MAERVRADWRSGDDRLMELRRQQEERNLEAIQGIQEIRLELESLAKRMQEKAYEFRRTSRKFAGEDSSSYVVFANIHMRLAGAILQGIRRATPLDGVLETRRLEQREAEEDRRREQVRENERVLRRIREPSEDALSELYGSLLEGEGLSNA